MGGYYLTNIFGKTQSNDNNAAKQEIKEVILQKTSENKAIKKQVPVTKKSLVDDTSKDSKVIDKSKSDVTVPNQSSMADIHEKYAAMDKRVQYGAYKIVGLDKEAQMRDGDNLESFSKRYLGPGMSCYIEVFNGIKANTPLKTGQTLKIPKLVKKKKLQKQL